MLTALFCSACGAQLTRPLSIRSGKDPSVERPELRYREPAVASGIAFKSYEPMLWSDGPDPAPLEFVPQYWLNPADLTAVVRQTKNIKRLNGCCGLDGTDGPNQLCACGAEIGSLRTDCWTPRVFIPEPDSTTWEAASDE